MLLLKAVSDLINWVSQYSQFTLLCARVQHCTNRIRGWEILCLPSSKLAAQADMQSTLLSIQCWNKVLIIELSFIASFVVGQIFQVAAVQSASACCVPSEWSAKHRSLHGMDGGTWAGRTFRALECCCCSCAAFLSLKVPTKSLQHTVYI